MRWGPRGRSYEKAEATANAKSWGTVGRSTCTWQAAWARTQEASQAVWPSDHREDDVTLSTRRSLEGVEVKDS